jgi:chemotaxis protein MotA
MTGGAILMALGAIFVSMIMDHGKPTSLINIPAMLLVFGGTIGVAAASNGPAFKSFAKVLKTALKPPKLPATKEVIDQLVSLAKEARSAGLLEMEKMAKDFEDEFLRKGIEVIASSSDPEQVRDILGAELIASKARHSRGAKIFADMGGFAPTLGILGTVIGLVHVLGDLSTPGKLGPAIASAFTATLWGVLSANVFWIPISNRLKQLNEAEVQHKELILEALLSIQAGTSTNALRDRLVGFLKPSERAAFLEGGDAPSKGKDKGKADEKEAAA